MEAISSQGSAELSVRLAAGTHDVADDGEVACSKGYEDLDGGITLFLQQDFQPKQGGKALRGTRGMPKVLKVRDASREKQMEMLRMQVAG